MIDGGCCATDKTLPRVISSELGVGDTNNVELHGSICTSPVLGLDASRLRYENTSNTIGIVVKPAAESCGKARGKKDVDKR